MEEAYGQSTALREARQDSLPGDSILSMGKEKGLYDRVIEKGSRIVERFPKNERQVPKAVFMMAESFRHKNEWRKAIEKYDELERYFPQYDSMPKAEYERAYCLYKNQDYALARFSAERIIETGENHKYYLPALELMSILQEKEGLPSDAIASLEAVLASSFGTPWTRARARMRLADLYYEQKNYEKAREHYLNKELFILPIPERYKAQSTAAECLFMASDEKEQTPKPIPVTVTELPKSVSVAQVLSESNLSKVCVGDFTNLLGKNDFDMAKFIKELPPAVAKVKTQTKAPLQFLFGPGPDNKITDIGITVGCLKTFPESPSQIQPLLKDISLKMGLNLTVATATNLIENSISANAWTEYGSNGRAMAAADEYKALADSTVFEFRKNLSLVRRGEILLSINDERGIKILRDIAYDIPKTEMAARAFFGIGDFRQKGKDYPAAILLYDSSYQSKPSARWAQESYSRKLALSKLLALKDTVGILQKAEKPFFPQEFQIAELFLLKLSETDSALILLARIDSTIEDPILKARATYTRAFIYDEFKQDTSKAYPLYRKIVENFPQTDYAKQAQANMGLQVNVKTKDDFASESFLKAEEAWLNAQKIPVENIEEIEAAYKKTIALYDSVITDFSGTQIALQAIYVKAYIFAEEIGNADSARVLWGKLAREYGKTPWGRTAYEKLYGRLSMDFNELAHIRDRVEKLEISTKQESEKYWQEMEQKKNAPPPSPQIVDDEVLLNDYNTLYDFK